MSVTALMSWAFVFGIPAWLVIEELANRFGIGQALNVRPVPSDGVQTAHRERRNA